MSDVEKTLLEQLKDPFDPKFVKWRVGATNKDKSKGIALAYIDSREVMKRLDDVCGIDGWQDRLIEVAGGFISEIDIRIGGNWVTRANAAGNTKVEPIKGGASDALKRAASKWGVGRYLYYLPNVWVEIKPQGNSYILAEIPDLPEWAKPAAMRGKTIERWEDVAELELEASATADQQETFEGAIASLDAIRGYRNLQDLEAFVKTLDDEQQLLLSNEINTKRRELKHESEINAT